MARTDTESIVTSGSTKDKLSELTGQLIEGIQRDALSQILKNTNYSGDPTTGSVEINRFKNATVSDYGTARAASKGTVLTNSGKVTINIDQDKEITEEIAKKDIDLFGVTDIVAKRTANHKSQLIAHLDRAFFTTAEAAATVVTLSTETEIEDIVEKLIQTAVSAKNDWVDGVDRADLSLTADPSTFGKLRAYIDKIDGGAGNGEVGYFHGVEVHENTRQTVPLLLQYKGAVAQPVRFTTYDMERIPLSHDFAVELFVYYGTKAIMPDLIFKMTSLTPPEPEDSGDDSGGTV